VAFLTGYDLAIVESGGTGELGAFKEWLNKRVGHPCSMNWAAVVRDEFAEKNEALAVEALFRLLREFIHESGQNDADAVPGGRPAKEKTEALRQTR